MAEVLAKGDRITDKDLLRDLREALDRIDLDSSMKVRILRTIQNPPEEPRMLSLAPIMGALFPNVREARKTKSNDVLMSDSGPSQLIRRFAHPSATASMTSSEPWSFKES